MEYGDCHPLPIPTPNPALASPSEIDARAAGAEYTTSLYISASGGRVYTDAMSRERWAVFETSAVGVPGACGRVNCLIFVTDLVVRRVWDYPENWFLLGDDDLAALSWCR